MRTYVNHRGVPGIWFLSLDAGSRPTVWGARRFFHLPYVHARMSARREAGDVVYRSHREDPTAPAATFAATYRPTGPAEPAAPESFEAWATDRWRLFAARPSGRIERTQVRHGPWPLQRATAELDAAGMAAAHGLTLPDLEPHLRYAGRVDVRGWWPRPVR